MNIKKPPQDDKYKIADCIDKIWNIVFIISITVTIVQKTYTSNIDKLLLNINALILSFLFFLEYFRRKYIDEATIIRRKNLFDTTFDLNRIHNRVDEFYDNQDIDDKVVKLFANNHESLFFTKNISLIMLRYKYFYIGIIVIVWIINIFDSGINENNYIFLVFLLSYFGIGRFIDIKSVHEGSSKLFEESLKTVDDMESGVKEKNIAEMIEILISYESLLSSTNFVLSQSIYDNKKEELTETWLEIKRKYSVYDEGINSMKYL